MCTPLCRLTRDAVGSLSKCSPRESRLPLHYDCEWDPVKAGTNFRKHGVSFQRAATVLRDPLAVSIFDDEHSWEEDRWITMARDLAGVLLVMVHTFEQSDVSSCTVRIISARRATKKEREQYEERVQ